MSVLAKRCQLKQESTGHLARAFFFVGNGNPAYFLPELVKKSKFAPKLTFDTSPYLFTK